MQETAPSAEPQGVAHTFSVTVTKNDGQKLGLDVSESLCVRSVDAGLVADWNALSAADRVQVGDYISEINGKRVRNYGEMKDAVIAGGMLTMAIDRPDAVQEQVTPSSATAPVTTPAPAPATPSVQAQEAQEGPQGVMEVQRKFMNQYGEQLEQLLSVGVYLVPIQDEEDDLAGFWSQAVYSVIDLFGLYRTVLLRDPDAVPVAPQCKALAPGLPEVAPRELLAESRRRYTVAAFALRSIRAVQVLIEMRALKFRGSQGALRVCFQVEVVKLALKLFLRSLMPFSFYVDEDALEEVEPPKGKKNPFGLPEPAAAPQPAPPAPVQLQAPVQGSGEVYVGSRTGKQLRPIASRAVSDPAVGDASAAASSSGAPSIAGLNEDRSDATQQMAVAEAVYHARPFVHLFLLMRRGQKSWLAWTVALLMDYLSHGLLGMQVQPRPKTRAAALESAELNRRRSALMWAFARNPFFERWLESHAVRLDNFIKKIPVLNIFNVMELFLVLRPFYFYTSAS